MKKSLGSGNGLQGTLCRAFGGEYFLRVKQADGGFVDYWLMHYDIDVTITDTTAWLYESADGDKLLDYCPQTLGIADDALDAYNEERLVSKFDKGAKE